MIRAQGLANLPPPPALPVGRNRASQESSKFAPAKRGYAQMFNPHFVTFCWQHDNVIFEQNRIQFNESMINLICAGNFQHFVSKLTIIIISLICQIQFGAARVEQFGSTRV